MSSLTSKEIITLRHLADGRQHREAPSTLSEAQYYMALKSLKSRDMVYAAFCEGEGVETAQIKKSGQAVIEDLKSAEKRILRQILTTKGFNQNQYDLLKYTQIHDISHTSEKFSQEFLQVNKHYFKDYVWKQLYDLGYLQTNKDRSGLILTPLGAQIIEEIEDEIIWQLTIDCKEIEIQVPDNRLHNEILPDITPMLKYCSDQEKCKTIVQMLAGCCNVDALKNALLSIDEDGSMIDMSTMDNLQFCRDIIPLVNYKTNETALKQVIHRLINQHFDHRR